jgi:3-phytase
MKYFISVIILLLTFSVLQSADCQQETAINSKLPVLKEAFHTERDKGDNVDSLAIWHGPEGQNWLLATAKEGNTIIVYDAADGSYIKRFGDGGSGAGQFKRPNGIAVIDDMVLVVERDNQRVQVFRLPQFDFLGYFGSIGFEDGLILPYGITAECTGENTYEVYITDNYNPNLRGYPSEGELEDRVHHFRFIVNENTIESEQLNIFGEIYNKGALHKVESICADRVHNRLLIADEAYGQRNIKVYDLDGSFTGHIISNRYFDHEPEGIALYGCDDGSGYWIATDQHESSSNKFQVFDRETLEYIGGFKGKITRNTDGICLTQKSFGHFDRGAFYAVHDDGSVTAIEWSDIAGALSLDKICAR